MTISLLITPEQVAFRNKALVGNLRSKYPRLSNYSDEVLIEAYDDWFMSAEPGESEDNFIDFIETED